MVQSDPAAAAELVSSEDMHANQARMAANVFSSWSLIDREAAVTWLEGLDLPRGNRQSMLENAASSLAHYDLDGAIALAQGIENENERNAVARAVLPSWAASNPREAKEWVMANMEGSTQRQALGQVIGSAAHADHEAAAVMYREASRAYSSDDEWQEFEHIPSQIVNTWAQQDMEAAGDWVMALPEDDHRKRAVVQLVDTVSDFDLEGAANFVLTLNDGPERDAAAQRISYEMRDYDPESSFLWANSIADDSSRSSQVRQSLNSWKRSDPEAARAAIQSADIPEDQRQHILEGWDE